MKELFRDGNWRLVTSQNYEPTPNNIAAIQHMCERRSNDRNNWCFVYEDHCARCGDTIPEALIGLQALTNWNR